MVMSKIIAGFPWLFLVNFSYSWLSLVSFKNVNFIISNVDYRTGSKKSKFDMTLISDIPFNVGKNNILVLNRRTRKEIREKFRFRPLWYAMVTKSKYGNNNAISYIIIYMIILSYFKKELFKCFKNLHT